MTTPDDAQIVADAKAALDAHPSMTVGQAGSWISKHGLNLLDIATRALQPAGEADAKIDRTEIETRLSIKVEKLLCAKLGKDWQPSGMSIHSLIDELEAQAPAPSPIDGQGDLRDDVAAIVGKHIYGESRAATYTHTTLPCADEILTRLSTPAPSQHSELADELADDLRQIETIRLANPKDYDLLNATFARIAYRIERHAETLLSVLRSSSPTSDVSDLVEALKISECWLTAALECKAWQWDGDQREAAIVDRENIRAALAKAGASG